MQIIATEIASGLADAVAKRLDLPPPVVLSTERFSNGQFELRCSENVKQNADVALFQVFPERVHDRLIELLLALDFVRSRGGKNITAVLPYLPYSRSDRPTMNGGPVPMRLIASLIEGAGLARLITLELHSPQLCGLFACAVSNLEVAPILARWLARSAPDNLTVLSPDFGGAKRAEKLAIALNCPFGVLRKRREGDSIHALELLGDVNGRAVVLIDDEINSGKTAYSAALRLKDCGAQSIALAAAHALFTPEAIALLETSPFNRIIVTDSTGLAGVAGKGFEVVPIAEDIAEALRR